ncbi:amidohydrolase family protein [Corynebacterium efficiens YS-314]|uniref:Putative hydrolase n=1 Tax=Corynebacterium efficiens (strain DSM 44549 / YS-314 / AJ 12310 / JCM 11189 / NBRC 100395) TaxID=196164 RepID=Q8FQN5_COREF|nr:amidohydrolase family protein [Corynebacterium efficiens]EEW49965.1 amidohydrolase family protein [Corynebacterium efficiens YS-314]BAC17894.1 putative hydrolase [Corynebacterium efficiens YS-314]
MDTALFDSHLHIIDPGFPLVENNGYLPPTFTVGDYGTRVAGLNVLGGAVVSGSFQAFDQSYLRDALRRLGPRFVGVTQIPATTSDERILELHAMGVRAVRVNLARGGSAEAGDLDRLARRVHEVAGWHTELYVTELAPVAEVVRGLPAVSIDHLGMRSENLPVLLDLVDEGVMVKATGFGRVDLDPVAAMRAIVGVNPGALMVGTDLPSTRARRPFADADLELAAEAVGAENLEAVFHGNAEALYLGGHNT